MGALAYALTAIGILKVVFLICVLIYYYTIYSNMCGNRRKHIKNVTKCSKTTIINESDQDGEYTTIRFKLQLGKSLPLFPLKYKNAKINVRLTSENGFGNDYKLMSRASHSGWTTKVDENSMNIEKNVKEVINGYSWMIQPPLPDDVKLDRVYIYKN